MSVNDILSWLCNAELIKREHFIKTAEYFKTESDIYYDCQLMSSLSGDNIDIVKEILRRSGVPTEEKTDRLITDIEPGRDLAEDLQLLLSGTNISEMYINLVSDIFHDNSDHESENRCNAIRSNLLKQSEWLSKRLKREIVYLPVT